MQALQVRRSGPHHVAGRPTHQRFTQHLERDSDAAGPGLVRAEKYRLDEAELAKAIAKANIKVLEP
ncbi:hypothetical protein AB0D42_37890 [Streptomyces sp. NPDC048304]|uniref:hypothetical protein n=1 Tax=Streptomyces sp. NPDC048304 TaxID=3154820 RepID=UPI0033F62317